MCAIAVLHQWKVFCGPKYEKPVNDETKNRHCESIHFGTISKMTEVLLCDTDHPLIW